MMSSGKQQSRDYLFDNYKVLLIALVVMGHFIELSGVHFYIRILFQTGSSAQNIDPKTTDPLSGIRTFILRFIYLYH